MKAGATGALAVALATVVAAAPAFADWGATGTGASAATAGSVSAPSSVTANCPNNSSTTTVTWVPVNTTLASWFVVETSKDGGSTWAVSATVQKTSSPFTQTVTTGDKSTTYSFRVTAKIANTAGSWSSSPTVSSNTVSTGTNSKC